MKSKTKEKYKKKVKHKGKIYKNLSARWRGGEVWTWHQWSSSRRSGGSEISWEPRLDLILFLFLTPHSCNFTWFCLLYSSCSASIIVSNNNNNSIIVSNSISSSIRTGRSRSANLHPVLCHLTLWLAATRKGENEWMEIKSNGAKQILFWSPNIKRWHVYSNQIKNKDHCIELGPYTTVCSVFVVNFKSHFRELFNLLILRFNSKS